MCNPTGLHARPCHAIARTAQAFRSELRVSCEGRDVNGKSILDLMTLCAPCEAVLSFHARGEDAEELVSALATLVEGGFGEQF
ncbi:MAG: HPr family phosphocarrier protein [Planctomycetes bacterium]|nr:HPr family phosphocarrier protein [Planctomycetota bacterium]